MTLLNQYAKQTKEIRIAVRCHRITTALHSSQIRYITYIKREVIIIFYFSHFVFNKIAGSFFKWCYHEGIVQHKNYMSMRYLFHPTRRRPFSYKLFINTKKKKKFPLERNIKIMPNSCQLLPWEKVTWRMIGNGCSFYLSGVQLVAVVSEGEQYRQVSGEANN